MTSNEKADEALDLVATWIGSRWDVILSNETRPYVVLKYRKELSKEAKKLQIRKFKAERELRELGLVKRRVK